MNLQMNGLGLIEPGAPLPTSLTTYRVPGSTLTPTAPAPTTSIWDTINRTINNVSRTVSSIAPTVQQVQSILQRNPDGSYAYQGGAAAAQPAPAPAPAGMSNSTKILLGVLAAAGVGTVAYFATRKKGKGLSGHETVDTTAEVVASSMLNGPKRKRKSSKKRKSRK